ncbi:MAG: hypothetical protein ACK58T_38220, partial [Phycisphaerae bacterium]
SGAYVSNRDREGNPDVTAGSVTTTGTSDGFRVDAGLGIYILPDSDPSALDGEGSTTTIDFGPVQITVIKDKDGNIIGGGVGGSAPIPGGSVAKTNTVTREQISANKTAKGAIDGAKRIVGRAKKEAIDTVKSIPGRVQPPLPCVGRGKENC